MQMPSVQTTYFALRGGLNLVSPPLSIPDGMCRDALNFECAPDGGYRPVTGYERFDGRTQPSESIYYTLPVTFSGTIVAGDAIIGATSGATGTVIAVDGDNVYFTRLTGSFVSAENITVSASVVANVDSVAYSGGAPTVKLDAQYKALAANVYRALIQAVPGSGSVLGVWRYKGVVYAFRNNVGGTFTDMYKSTSSGWVNVDLGYEVRFTNANTSVNDGDTLTQGGVTATIRRVVVETGTLLSGTNTGKLILNTPSGGTFGVGAASSTGGGSLTLASASSPITIPINGKYSFSNYNFGGASGTLKMYGANGVGRMFEFDGTVFVPISTGMAVDTPSYIATHANYLWASFDASLQKSVIGEPYQWDAVLGAAEFGIGDTITGLLPLLGSNTASSLAVFSTNKTSILYGSSSSDFQLVPFSFEAGAYPFTAQNIGQAFVMDEMGIRQLAATQDFGNFADGKISKLIRPFLQSKASLVTCSTVSRVHNQYRIYFSDKYGLHVTFDNGKIIGIMPIKTNHAFNCMSSTETGDGNEYILAGGTDGYVYRLNKGTSFDGENISGYINLSFSHQKSPRGRKRYRKAVYEITGETYAEMQVSYEIGYGSTDINQGFTQTAVAQLGSVFWDNFTWDSFYWDGRNLLPTEQELTGTAENVSLIIRCDANYIAPFTVHSVILHYTNRRQLR